MKTLEQKLIEHLKLPIDAEHRKGFVVGFRKGHEFVQRFIPVTEEYPPYDEDILIRTERNTYFGKLKGSSGLYGDYFQPDLTESDERIRVKNIVSWRPIFYK